MKVQLELKEFQEALLRGVIFLFNDQKADLTDIITPFGTFHYDGANSRNIRMGVLNIIRENSSMKIESIKHVRIKFGCGLKVAKDFVEKICADIMYANDWVSGDDEWIKSNFDVNDYMRYCVWARGENA